MDQTHERRADTRLFCADLVELLWTDSTGQEYRKVGNLEDISLCGLGVQLELPIRIGTRVCMLYGSEELAGTVRYSFYRDQACFIGIELDEGSRWSTTSFVPRHLLDPRELFGNVILRYGNSTGSTSIQ